MPFIFAIELSGNSQTKHDKKQDMHHQIDIG
jgi:hypothetical protein